MIDFEKERCAKQPCECKTLPLPSRTCSHDQCPRNRCLGDGTTLIERVREWSMERSRSTWKGKVP